jgi:hypothetical protein
MCYSPESSFGTFFFVFLMSIVLWNQDSPLQKTLAIILVFIALMQVLEGALWLNTDCSDINRSVSSLIPILLYLQPLVVVGSIYFFNTGLLSPTVYKALFGLWLVALPMFIESMRSGIGRCTTVGANGYLEWPYEISLNLVQIVYNTILFVSFLSLKTEWYGAFYALVATAGYYKSRELYGHAWGSVWCHFVNSLAVGALFVK